MKLIHKNNGDKILENADIFFPKDNLEYISEELRKVENKFYQVFDLNPCPMAINTLTDNTIIDVNQSYMDIIGIKDKKEVIGKDTTETGLNIIKKKDKLHVMNMIKLNGVIKNYLTTVKPIKGKKFKGLFSGSIITLNGMDCLLTICQVVTNRYLLNLIL